MSTSETQAPDRALHDWFKGGLAAAPDGDALRIGDRSWTYAQVHEMALSWAGTLQAASPERLRSVGVLAAASPETYVGILAASYAGAAVVPLSPAFPAERTAVMAEAAAADAFIADGKGADILGQTGLAGGGRSWFPTPVPPGPPASPSATSQAAA